MKRHFYRNEALWSLITQFCVPIIAFPLVWMCGSLAMAGSFAIGSLICVLPNIYLYRRTFAHQGARKAKKIVKAFYWGEVVKLLITGLGFAGALFISWLHPLWLFVGYIATQLGFWLGPLVLGLLKMRVKRDERQ
jgi:ATP synthase protein I